ncbi:hypothetical protein FDP25_11725 [Roseovarius sp. A21]|uniref:Cellulose-binding protein n=1 Tax=Roseovarius bejariae TaxID=2576383 RepID=A0A844CVL9_9RHOB|nr:hypothetical protein [Roseovarius bejariae]MRU16099.1 hypothetical protein [Roseovarius bejariae]
MNLGAILLSVLLVGHSLFGQTGPRMLEQLLKAGGHAPEVSAQIINGAPLRYNWDNGREAKGDNAREVLAQGGVNAVILTEAIPLADQIKWNDSAGFAGKFHALAVEGTPEAQVFLQETWPRGAPGAEWRAAIAAQAEEWQGIVDDVNAARPDGSPPMRLLPAGQSMLALHAAIEAGEVTGLDGLGPLFDDDIHLSDLGHYYIALVQYGFVTGQSPVGLPHRLTNPWGKPYDAPPKALAAELQTVAAGVAGGGKTAKASPKVKQPPAPQAGGNIGIGLAAVNDWSVQQPFLDVMKTARPWIVHRPGQWGGAGHAELVEGGYLDEDGWPKRLPREMGTLGTVILTDLPEEATYTEGRYRLSFEGKGIVEVGGRARNTRYSKGEVRFDFTPGPGPVDIRIQRSDPEDPVRKISVVKEEHIARFKAGEVFNPLWIDRLRGLKLLRFMDWMETNNSEISQWSDRPKPEDYTYALNGVPLEIMLQLSRKVGADVWLNIPHRADDAFVRDFAAMVRDGLPEDRKVYAEYSNEVWNFAFEQARWAAEQAQRRWDAKDAGAQFYGMRAAQVARIWSEAWGEDGSELINVISSQTGWLGLEELVFEAPLWMAEPESDGVPPWIAFDAYAVTGYFGGILGTEARADLVKGWLNESRAAAVEDGHNIGLTGAELDAHVKAHRFDLAMRNAGEELKDGALSGDAADTVADLLGRVLPYHAEVAQAHGLQLVMYEGGSHVVGIGEAVNDAELTAFFQALNYSPEMAVLYDRLLHGWRDLTDGVFTAYADVYAPTKWGSWGHLRHLGDDNPRWDALRATLTCEVNCE